MGSDWTHFNIEVTEENIELALQLNNYCCVGDQMPGERRHLTESQERIVIRLLEMANPIGVEDLRENERMRLEADSKAFGERDRFQQYRASLAPSCVDYPQICPGCGAGAYISAVSGKVDCRAECGRTTVHG